MRTQTKIEGVMFSAPAGGRVAIPPGGTVAIPGPIQQLSAGVAFGPLTVQPETAQLVGIAKLAFPRWDRSEVTDASGRDEVTHLAAGSVAAASLADGSVSFPDSLVGRRGFLAGAGVVLGGAVLRADALTGDEQPGAHLELVLSKNPGGVIIGLVEAVTAGGNAVPAHDVRLNGAQIGRLTVGLDKGVLVPPGQTGRVTIQIGSTGTDN